MAITAPSSIVIPAVSEKTYPEQWIYNLSVSSSTLSTGRLTIELIPYNATTQEIGSTEFCQVVQSDQLWRAVEEVPAVATAFQAVIDCVEPLRTWIAAQP